MNRKQFIEQSAMALLATALIGCFDNKKGRLQKNQVIACIGDSVTNGGGNGYVEILQTLANEKWPDMNLTFLNWGKSSETITGLTEIGHPGPRPYLFERLDGLLKNTPIDIAMFCYGINCGIYGMPSPELFNKYKIGVYSFLEKVKQKNIRTILLTPPPLTLNTVSIELDPEAEYTWLNPYPKYDKEVLQEFKKIILNTQHEAVITNIDIHSPLSKNQADCYDKDPIHPNMKGHRLIAETIIENLAF